MVRDASREDAKRGDHHQVSHSASDTKPAKLFALFMVDTADKKFVIPEGALFPKP